MKSFLLMELERELDELEMMICGVCKPKKYLLDRIEKVELMIIELIEGV